MKVRRMVDNPDYEGLEKMVNDLQNQLKDNPKKTVLIVDDNSQNLYLLKGLLEGENLEVIAAENGKDALDKAYAARPALIVSDILMPVMDGYTFCRLCKSDEQLKGIPFVFYTATYTEPKDERFALSLGADRFLLKPLEPEILIQALQEVLDEKYIVKYPSIKPSGEDTKFFEGHSEILLRKLEKKISDLETAYKKLDTSELNFGELFNHIKSGVAIYVTANNGIDFLIKDVNKAVESIEQVVKAEIVGRSVLEVFPAVKEFGLFDVFQRVWKTGIDERFPLAFYEDGRIFGWRENYVYKLPTGEIVAVYDDITKEKQAEEALLKSEEKYRLSFTNITDIIYSIDSETLEITAISPSVEKILGYKAEELIGRPFHELNLLTKESLERAAADTIDIFSGKTISSAVYDFIAKDGSQRTGEVSGSPLYKNGKIIGLTAVARDVTERKLAEQALNYKTSFLEALINSSVDGILVVDNRGKKIFQNQRTVDIWKIPQHIACDTDDTLQVKHVMQMTENPEQFVEKIKYLYDHQDETSSDYIRLTDGTILERYSAPVIGKDGQNYGRIWMFHDITEHRKLEQRIIDLARFPEENASPVYRISESGELLFANPAGKKLIHSIISPITEKDGKITEQWKRKIKEIYDSGMKHNEEIEIDGRVYSFDEVPIAERGYVNLYATDITEIKKNEQRQKILLEAREIKDKQGLAAMLDYVASQGIKLSQGNEK
jgi:PAS domain S-box-containing protein